MTLRMGWLYVAMASFALVASDVSTTRAQGLSPCDIDPNSCQYTPSGRGYWYPPGYRRPSDTVTRSAGGNPAVTAHKKSVRHGSQGNR
jgi:hypothetical protein